MTDIETSLRRSYASCEQPMTDVVSLVEGARRQGRVLRRRRRAAVALAVSAVVVAAVLGGTALDGTGTHHRAIVPTATAPVASGPVLTVYRFSTSTGPARIVSFLDMHGRWCLGAEQSVVGGGTTTDYKCVGGELPLSGSGFGHVASTTDAFGYDGINQWLQGVATNDVAHVKVVLADGKTRAAQLVHETSGVVFSVRVPWLVTPSFYRAYDARGRLVEQLRVPQSLPHDPFVDWRPFADTSSSGPDPALAGSSRDDLRGDR